MIVQAAGEEAGQVVCHLLHLQRHQVVLQVRALTIHLENTCFIMLWQVQTLRETTSNGQGSLLAERLVMPKF